jgi:hypothetical protein
VKIMAVVKVAFKTAIQKFAVDAEVSEQDDLSPHTFESLKVGGFIGEKAETKVRARSHLQASAGRGGAFGRRRVTLSARAWSRAGLEQNALVGRAHSPRRDDAAFPLDGEP